MGDSAFNVSKIAVNEIKTFQNGGPRIDAPRIDANISF